MMQDIPDLQSALVSYQEARARISDRRRSRGFWPPKGRTKGHGKDHHGGFRGGRKGGQKGGKEELLSRISRTHCKLCGALGHWKAECPTRRDQARESANVVQHDGDQLSDLPQVIVEEVDEAGSVKNVFSECFHVQDFSMHPSKGNHGIPVNIRAKAVQFLSHCLSLHRSSSSNRMGIDKRGVKGNSKRGYQQKYDYTGAKDMMPRKSHRPTNMDLFQRRSSDATCLMSQLDRRSQNGTGLAIIDTGASRSVIGSDNVPAVLQKLPSKIREMVKEKPSNVGFRFGNNHIAYSFKQLQIPLMYGKHRIWLLIEVVPKGTPFLLSIKTMKSLGATLDLASNTCFLKTLNRSLPLRENANGLFVIDMSDLCQVPEEINEAALTASSIVLTAPPGLTIDPPSDHFDAPRCARSSPIPFGGSVSQPSPAVLHAVFHDIGQSTSRASVRTGNAPNSAVDSRSEEPAQQDHGVEQHHFEPVQSIHGKESSEPNWNGDGEWCLVGSRRDGRDHARACHTRASKEFACSGAKHFPTEIFELANEPTDKHSTSSSVTDCRHAHQWVPASSSTSNPSSSPDRSGSQPGGPHTDRPRKLGTESRDMGQEKQGAGVCERIREGRGIREMGAGPSGESSRGHRRLCKLRHHQAPIGERSDAERAPVNEWQPIPESRTAMACHVKSPCHVRDVDEAAWLKEMCKLVNKGGNKCKQLDLLEVYAYPKSQLTEVAQASGLHARRFTMEDGDLSTKAGQSELLSWIVLYRPKHVWLSPECGPWCAWSRFNSQRSLQSFQNVQDQRKAARVHLKFCQLLAKIQISEGRHVHMENPWTSELWNQDEICEFVQASIAACLDQCMFGLRHPETANAMQKKTRVQTTSRAVFQELDQRICDHSHQHSQIAGRCRVHEMSIQVSKFANFYPRAFAKAIVKGIIRTKDLPIEKPIYHVEEDVEEPPKRGQK